MITETLSDQVNRAKARWLKRVMYESVATSTQKCFAYSIADHLNCVTMDCWAGQPRFARLLGRQSIKTVQRAAGSLARLELLKFSRCGKAKSSWRYAPVFLASDWDQFVAKGGQPCPGLGDRNVRQSFLEIQLRSFSTAADDKRPVQGHPQRFPYKRAERGSIEVKVAEMLGQDGMKVLGVLSALDDLIVDRLCGAYVEGMLGERELAAARLAAEQVR
jgi:hypothetical protein